MATASISTIGRAVRDRLPEGKMTWKKMMRHAGENYNSPLIIKLDTLIECNVSFSVNIIFLRT